MPKPKSTPDSKQLEGCLLQISIEQSTLDLIDSLAALGGIPPELVVKMALRCGLAKQSEEQNKLDVFQRLRNRV